MHYSQFDNNGSEHGDDENRNDLRNELTGNSNLIVNYLPHDIDDATLKVK